MFASVALKNNELPDLRQLNTFVSIVEHASFSAAARVLAISQPSVSQQMKRLEAWIGRPIFAREGASSTLTPDGEALLVFARAMIVVSGQACAHFKGADYEGSVRLGLNEVFAATAIPKVLALFCDMHARFELLLETSFDTPDLFTALDEGRLDVVVAKTYLSDARGEVVERVPLVWVGRDPHMHLPDGPVPLVVSSAQSSTRELMFEALAHEGRDWTIRFRSQNLAALDTAVSTGVGVTATMKGLRTGDAVALDESCGLPTVGEVALCLDVARGIQSPAVIAFVMFLKQVIAELDLGGKRSASHAAPL